MHIRSLTLAVVLVSTACSSDEGDGGGQGGSSAGGSGSGAGGSGSGGASGGVCSEITTTTFTSVTQESGSDPLCPVLTLDDLNGGGDGGADCSFIPSNVTATGCTLTVDCTIDSVALQGTFTIEGSSLTGDIVASLPMDGGAVECGYSTAGTVQ